MQGRQDAADRPGQRRPVEVEPPRTVQYVHAVLRVALNQAVDFELFPVNVGARVDAPSVVRDEVAPLSVKQARRFLAAVAGHRLEAVYRVAIALGLRTERRLAGDQSACESVQPVVLAQMLGYRPSPFELGQRVLPPEERLPRAYIAKVYEALERAEVSLAWAAEALGISDLELEERTARRPVAEPEEVYA